MATAAQAAEQDLVNRISMARGNAEPPTEPTPEPEVVDVSASEAPEEVETEDVQDVVNLDAEGVAEPEELASTEADTDPVEDKPVEFVELNGREITLTQIEEWEQGSLRQADYTRKTQALANDRKSFEAEQSKFNAQKAELDSSLEMVNAILSEESLSASDLTSLRDYDPDGFIKYGEKINKRKSAVAKAKAARGGNFDQATENQKLFDAHPEWLKDGKVTDECGEALGAIGNFAVDSGQYTAEEVNAGLKARDILNLHNTIQLNARNVKNANVEKRVRKAPVTTRPSAVPKTAVKTQLQKAEAKLKQTGKAEDAVIVRQLRRKLNSG